MDVLKVLFVVFALSLGTSCANVSPDVAEYRRSVDRENYELCTTAYKANRTLFLHVDHLHPLEGAIGMPEVHAIRHDLAVNNCHQVLGEYWAEY